MSPSEAAALRNRRWTTSSPGVTTVRTGDGITRIVMDSSRSMLALYNSGKPTLPALWNFCPACGEVIFRCPITHQSLHHDGTLACDIRTCANCGELIPRDEDCPHCLLDERKEALECDDCNRLDGNLVRCRRHRDF